VDGALHVRDGDEVDVYRFTPADWATYLNRPVGAPSGHEPVVPAAIPLDDSGLPRWASDELVELGAWPSPYEIVDGHLVGREPDPDG